MTQGDRGAKCLQLPETLSRLDWSFLFVLCIFFSWPVFATYSGFWVSSGNCSRTYPGYQNPQMFKSHIHSLVSMVLHLQIQPTSNPLVLWYCMYLLGKKACISGPLQFKPMLFKGQLYIPFWTEFPSSILPKEGGPFARATRSAVRGLYDWELDFYLVRILLIFCCCSPRYCG